LIANPTYQQKEINHEKGLRIHRDCPAACDRSGKRNIRCTDSVGTTIAF
jgi:hypothetical protein